MILATIALSKTVVQRRVSVFRVVQPRLISAWRLSINHKMGTFIHTEMARDHSWHMSDVTLLAGNDMTKNVQPWFHGLNQYMGCRQQLVITQPWVAICFKLIRHTTVSMTSFHRHKPVGQDLDICTSFQQKTIVKVKKWSEKEVNLYVFTNMSSTEWKIEGANVSTNHGLVTHNKKWFNNYQGVFTKQCLISLVEN